MSVKEAIILAGGFGTRLQPVVSGVPKCLAPVAGHPFLKHVVRYLLSQGIERFILSLGYKHERIEEFMDREFPSLPYEYSIEEEPLGTGGGVRLACRRTTDKTVLVVNGDTLFKANLAEGYSFHCSRQAECTVLLKPMRQFDRYGIVELENDGTIRKFREKQFVETGDINAGAYFLDVESFLSRELPQKFSFEKDYLEKFHTSRKIFGLIQDAYFIDIGIPDDYRRAQDELKQIPLHLENVRADWTVFLDRDGVINVEKEDHYILNWNEFAFYPGVADAIRLLAEKFNKIIVVSNQRGIGRGLMSEQDLHDIQQRMKATIEEKGGRIDKIYYCPAADAKSFCRKPNPGMALQALKDFPGIDLSKSIMVGNKPSDMQFGRNAGTYTVYLKTTHPDQALPHPDIDLDFDSLHDFAKAL